MLMRNLSQYWNLNFKNMMSKMLKRIFDITISLFAIVVLSPLFIFLAYKVKKNLGEPILFRQIRPGLNGKPFEMIKFRTMKDLMGKDGNSLSDEDRLTDFGKKLRSTSLDELPELWNVLKGDMSLVGPRPLLMEYLPLYNDEQAKRHNVKPGITGYAQVNGRNAISWEEKFKLDAWYVDNQSLILDMKILFQTVRKVLYKENINAEGQTTISKFKGSKPKNVFAIYGSSGCGRSLMPIAREYLSEKRIKADIYFIDDSLENETIINNHKALNYDRFKALEVENKFILIAIADSHIREKLLGKIEQDKMQVWSIISNDSVVMDNVEIADGAAISPFVTIGSNVKIGKSFHANLYSYVEHDCIIGDYVTFAPGVKCNGNVHIEDHVYVGAGAIIKQGTKHKPLNIGKGAIIGMGAVVTKDIPDGMIVVGCPARELNKSI